MRIGSQKPTFSIVGDYAYSNGAEVCEMFEEDAGKKYFDCQKDEITYILAKKEDGSPAFLVVSILKPRQNGKSFSARDAATYYADFEHKNVLYSAHNGSTTKKMASEVFALFENEERFPDFYRDVKFVSHARGYEGITFNDYKDDNGEWQNGGLIDFRTRTNSGARGGTYNVIIIDEAQELTDDQYEALMPVISAAADASSASEIPQIILLGTPPSPSCNGTVLPAMRKKAIAGQLSDVCWLEWSLESDNIYRDIPDVKTAIELAYKTNPAMGLRISERTVESEFNTMRLDGFARERLNWWSKTTGEKTEYALDKEKWSACASDLPKPEGGKTAYGIKFSSDGTQVALAGACISADGIARISLINQKDTSGGLRWLSDWLNERYNKASCVVIDGRNNVDLVCERISETWKAKGSVVRPSTKDVIASASLLVDAVGEGNISWYKFQEVLNDSAVNATKRPIAGGYGFGGDNSIPIEACALALWGAKTSKRDPNRKMRIG